MRASVPETYDVAVLRAFYKSSPLRTLPRRSHILVLPSIRGDASISWAESSTMSVSPPWERWASTSSALNEFDGEGAPAEREHREWLGGWVYRH